MTAHGGDRIKIPTAFWGALQAMGVSAADLIRLTRLPLALLSEPVAVTTSQYFAVWQAIQDLTGDAAIGIKFVTTFPSGQLPPSLLAAYHARDFRDALRRLARYKQLCAPERLRLSLDPPWGRAVRV